jgi:hypothetical protein
MSGGHFDYLQYRINDIADEVEHLIESNDDATPAQWGDPGARGYTPQTIARFREGLRFLRMAAIYAQRIDWLVSGDDGEDSFHQRLAEELADFEGLS